MKKFKIFLAIAIAATATVAAGFYSYQTTQNNMLSQVELAALEANIEALTQGERQDYDKAKTRPCNTCVITGSSNSVCYSTDSSEKYGSMCLRDGGSCIGFGPVCGTAVGTCYY